MKRSTLILGLGLCAVVFLYGREREQNLYPSRPMIAQGRWPASTALAQAGAGQGGTTVRLPSSDSTSQDSTSQIVVTKTLGDHAGQIARLEAEYRNHAGFRQLVADFNAATGHPDRGEKASLEALDQNVDTGAPVFGLMQAVQPRAVIARALERHWRDERERRDRDSPAP